MKRRAFLKTSSLAGAAVLSGGSSLASMAAPAGREFYELRVYEMPTGNRKAALNDYLEKAAIPAWNRLGISPVGVFTVVSGANALTLYVLIPYPDLDAFLVGAREAGRRRGVPEGRGRLPRGVDRQSGLHAVRELAAARLRERPPGSRAGRDGREEAAPVRAADLREPQRDGGGEEDRDVQRRGRDRAVRPHRHRGRCSSARHSRGRASRTWSTWSCTRTWPRARRRGPPSATDPEWKKLGSDPAFANTVSATDVTFLRPAAYSQL